jgi:hypothetical protein
MEYAGRLLNGFPERAIGLLEGVRVTDGATPVSTLYADCGSDPLEACHRGRYAYTATYTDDG